ncbi:MULTISPECIES: hypothetical protein [Bacillaceae]|uniref:Uncharacterized protein n=1 Tax=Evansella alkalicola TaxID=745819 RepID=A0ABS6JZB7_9BACI|nr:MULTISPECIES: hypothetical protein [Bacillaceae]MBU9723935.1 hypothetical protein [Bacillus alkalicola]
MNLVQVLLSQPQSELIKRVKSLGLTCNAHSRQELTEELTKALLHKETTLGQWNALHEEEQNLLLQMSFSINVFYPLDELYGRLKKSQRSNLPTQLQKLKEKGWIFEDNNNNYIVPKELKDWVVHNFIEKLRQYSIFMPDDKTNDFNFINDLFVFMDYVEETKIRLTRNGTIYRKQLMNILSQLSRVEEIPNEQWRFGYGRHYHCYPDNFSLLYDFCFGQNWLKEETELLITPRWEKGQELSVKEILDRVFRSYVQLYKRAIPQLPFIIEVLNSVLTRENAIEEGDLINSLKGFVDPYYYDEVESIIKNRILNMLHYIHFLTIQELDGCKFYYLHPRISNEKENNKKFKQGLFF